MKSKLWTVGWIDIFKGLLMTVLTAFLGGIGNLLTTGAFPTGTQIKYYLIASLAAGVGYVLKNLGTNSQDQLLTKEPPSPLSQIGQSKIN